MTFDYVLIDADSLIYYTCWKMDSEYPTATDYYKFLNSQNHLKSFIFNTLENCGALNYYGFLSPSKTFRNFLYPEYKANRKSNVRPKNLYKIKLWMIEELGFEYHYNYEADDLVASAHYTLEKRGKSTVVFSRDKDLKQIAGWHYNIKERSVEFIKQDTADNLLKTQMLTGDVADNIKGIKGIGPKRAKKLLAEKSVKEVYKDNFRNWKEMYRINEDLLKLKTDLYETKFRL